MTAPHILANDIHASRHAAGAADPVTPSAIGAVPTTRTVNGYTLANDITLAAGDLTGPYTLAQMAPGGTFTVLKVGANWTYAGTTVTTRPSNRTDLTMISLASDGTTPSFALTNDIGLT